MRKGVFGAFRFYPKYSGSVVSDLELHCLLMSACPKTYSYNRTTFLLHDLVITRT